MAEIVLQNLVKKFNEKTVVDSINLTIEDQAFVVLVGPSGCGKTTTLRMIAGLEKPTSGQIHINGTCVNDIAPGDRDVAMVFQNYAIYPTMSVRDNIEFGLKNRKVPKEERNKLIVDICDIVGLSDYLDRKPSTLSGGQRQRVALARAMVKKPSVFLMDEPLSNLDAKLRNQMRTELIQLHQRLATTFIYVTHDQVEAMSMGTKIVVMDEGVIMQESSTHELYHHPNNVFAAQFIGNPPMNIFRTDLFNMYGMDMVDAESVGFRPEKVRLSEATSSNDELGLVIGGVIKTRELLGSEAIYLIQSDVGSVKVKSYEETAFSVGDKVKLSIQKNHLHYFDGHGTAMPSGK